MSKAKNKKPIGLTSFDLTKWNEVELKLIHLVKEHPELYNGCCAGRRLTQFWKFIAATMDVPVKKCMGRWKSIRQSYVKHIIHRDNLVLLDKRWSATKYGDGTLGFLDEFIKVEKNKNKKRIVKRTENLAHNTSINALDETPTFDANKNKMKTPSPPKQSHSHDSSKTVLTAEIIDYIIKARSEGEEVTTVNDVIQSIANFLSDDTTPDLPVAQTNIHTAPPAPQTNPVGNTSVELNNEVIKHEYSNVESDDEPQTNELDDMETSDKGSDVDEEVDVKIEIKEEPIERYDL